jgi:hypothetical protein
MANLFTDKADQFYGEAIARNNSSASSFSINDLPEETFNSLTDQNAERGRLRIDGKYHSNIWDYKGSSKTMSRVINGMGSTYRQKLYPHINGSNAQHETNIDMDLWTREEMVSPGLAYVPWTKGVNGINSGVTFADGIDVGGFPAGSEQIWIDNMVNAGLPMTVVEKLRPFIGLQGQAAKDVLENYHKEKGMPFQLTWNENVQLSRAYHNMKIGEIKAEFDRGQPTGKKFVDLPPEWQSAYYTMRSNLASPNLKKQLQEGRYEDAKQNLSKFLPNASDTNFTNKRGRQVLEYVNQKETERRDVRFWQGRLTLGLDLTEETQEPVQEPIGQFDGT